MRKSTTVREIRVDTEARYKKMFLLLSLPDTKTRYRTHIYRKKNNKEMPDRFLCLSGVFLLDNGDQ